MYFKDNQHKERYRELTPGINATDPEWAPVAFIVASDDELWKKCRRFMDAKKREIEWELILKSDFGGGHKAALHWAFAMWAGHSWGGWTDDDNIEIPMTDIMARAVSMGVELARVVHQALSIRWGI